MKKMELLWPVLDPGTTIEMSRLNIDVEGNYKSLVQAIKERLLLLEPDHFAGKKDVVMGIASVDEEEHADRAHHHDQAEA